MANANEFLSAAIAAGLGSPAPQDALLEGIGIGVGGNKVELTEEEKKRAELIETGAWVGGTIGTALVADMILTEGFRPAWIMNAIAEVTGGRGPLGAVKGIRKISGIRGKLRIDFLEAKDALVKAFEKNALTSDPLEIPEGATKRQIRNLEAGRKTAYIESRTKMMRADKLLTPKQKFELFGDENFKLRGKYRVELTPEYRRLVNNHNEAVRQIRGGVLRPAGRIHQIVRGVGGLFAKRYRPEGGGPLSGFKPIERLELVSDKGHFLTPEEIAGLSDDALEPEAQKSKNKTKTKTKGPGMGKGASDRIDPLTRQPGGMDPNRMQSVRTPFTGAVQGAAEAGGLVTDARSGRIISGASARTPPPGATRAPALARAGSQGGSIALKPPSLVPPQLQGPLRDLHNLGRGGRKQLLDAVKRMGGGVRGAARSGLGTALLTGFAVKGMFSNLVDNMDRGMNPVAAWGDATIDAVGDEAMTLGEFLVDTARFVGTPTKEALEYPIERAFGLREKPAPEYEKGLSGWFGLGMGEKQYDAEGNPIIPSEEEKGSWEADPAGGWFSEGDPVKLAEEERNRGVAERMTQRQNELTMHGPYGDPKKEGTPNYVQDVLGQNWEQHTGADRRAPIRLDPSVDRGAQLEQLKETLLWGGSRSSLLC